jgi:hypothetical protein
MGRNSVALQVKIKQLMEWSKLDERAVQADLLYQLESASVDLASLGGAFNELISRVYLYTCTFTRTWS